MENVCLWDSVPINGSLHSFRPINRQEHEEQCYPQVIYSQCNLIKAINLKNSHGCLNSFYGSFFKILCVYFQREGEKHWGERETSIGAPVEDQTLSSGMCPDRESNRQLFTLGDDTQPTEPHQPGLMCFILLQVTILCNKEKKNK